MKKPKAPKAGAQEIAMERRQSMLLDKEIEEQEQRFKKLSRGSLGTKSLLAKSPAADKAAAPTPAANKAPSMLAGLRGR